MTEIVEKDTLDFSQDSYNELMKDSVMRKHAADVVISTIEGKLLSKDKNTKCLAKIREILMEYPVEDGVSVFIAGGKGIDDKTMVAKVDNANEYVELWWGDNKNYRPQSNVNRYALGLIFRNKLQSEVREYSLRELNREFPDFETYWVRAEKLFQIVVYHNAEDMIEAVSKQPGRWLLRQPEWGEGSIGKKLGNTYHLFQEGMPQHPFSRYKMKIKKTD